MKLKKHINKKTSLLKDETETDWDFDFKIYEKEEKKESETKSIIKDNKPRITGLVSKYGASIETITLLINVRTTLSEKSIKVAGRSDDIKDLWEFYGCINEAFAIIKDIWGTLVIEEIRKIDNVILKQLLEAQKHSVIPNILYKNLLVYRDKIYMLIQRSKLGLEVEKIRGSHFDKARKGIVE